MHWVDFCCLQVVEMTLKDCTQAELFRDHLVDLFRESGKREKPTACWFSLAPA